MVYGELSNDVLVPIRSRAYFRHHRIRLINRRKGIAKANMWAYSVDGKFAKGKVPWDGKSARWKPEFGPKWSDRKKLISHEINMRELTTVNCV